MKKYLVGFLAGLVGVAGLAGAASVSGIQSIIGSQVDVSTGAPVVAQTGETISAQVGGGNFGKWTATGTTTGAGTLTFPDAVVNGRVCVFRNISHPGATNAIDQTAATDGKTVVTIAGTIVSGDVIGYNCGAF